MRMTDKGVEALKPKPKRYEAWEDGRTGFGVRVSIRGRKSWLFMYRFDRKARRMTLGAYPFMGVADARIAYAAAKKKLELGIDPGAEALGKKKAERNAETVKDLIDEYMERYARPNKRSAHEDERILNKDVAPEWGNRKAREITRRDAIRLLDKIVDRGSPIMANRTLSALKKVWNFALDRDILDATPFARIKPPTKENHRDRI